MGVGRGLQGCTGLGYGCVRGWGPSSVQSPTHLDSRLELLGVTQFDLGLGSRVLPIVKHAHGHGHGVIAEGYRAQARCAPCCSVRWGVTCQAGLQRAGAQRAEGTSSTTRSPMYTLIASRSCFCVARVLATERTYSSSTGWSCSSCCGSETPDSTATAAIHSSLRSSMMRSAPIASPPPVLG